MRGAAAVVADERTKARPSRLARSRIRPVGTGAPQAVHDAPSGSGLGRSRGPIGGKSTGATPVATRRVVIRYPQGVSSATPAPPAPTTARGSDQPMSPTEGRRGRRPARPQPLPTQLLEGQGPARPPPVADGGPGPRHRPDDRARGVLRRHPPADGRPAGRRRCAVDRGPRGPRRGLRPDRRRARRGRRLRGRGHRRRPATLGRPVRSSGRRPDGPPVIHDFARGPWTIRGQPR